MTRYDFRWIRRHPLRWVRLMWLPWLVATMFVTKSIVIREPVYQVTTAAWAWPSILLLLALVILACAVWPLDSRVQALAAGSLFGVGVLRVLTYGDTLVRADISSGGQALAVGFALHWTLIAAMAAWWPSVIETAGREMAVAAGVDDRGGS